MPAPRLHAVAVGCAMVSGMLVGAGCSAGSSPQADARTPTVTASITPTPSPSDEASLVRPVVTELLLPRGGRGAKGAHAFTTYVVKAWAYTLSTNDVGPLLDVSTDKPCAGCKELGAELRQREAEGWSVFPFDLEPRKVRLKELETGDIVALAAVDLPATRSYFDDGSFRNDSPAHPGTTFTVVLRLVKKAYTLVSFTLS